MSLTLHDPMDCGPTRLLCPWHFPGRNTGVAISSSRGSSCKIITSHFFQVGSKEIKTVNPKGNQSWIFIGRTDAEADAPILWSPDVKSWLIGKDPDAGKDWRQEEKGTTEGETVREDHRLNGHELGQVWEMVKDREAWCTAIIGSQRVGHDLVTEQQQQFCTLLK